MNDILTILFNGLTYGGDLNLTIINYAITVITIIPFLSTNLKSIVFRWKLILLIAVILQSFFWFILLAQGISIIWNTLAGLLIIVLLRIKSQLSKNTMFLIYLSIVSAIIADVYFGVSFPLITTIAHLVAIAMGIFLYFLLMPKKSRQ